MISYSILAFTSVVIFALVHLLAVKTRGLDKLAHGRFLSAGSGVAIAYVFIDILPKLDESDKVIRTAFSSILPFLEYHAYILALTGFLVFFAVDRTHDVLPKKAHFWVSLLAYALFNFLVGYAIVDKNNPEVQPLALFTFAMALHYFANDYSLNKTHGVEYRKIGKWILIGCLFLGWAVGYWQELSKTAIALVSAFIAGGIIMNVTRHELPNDSPHSLGAFVVAAVIYTMLLLSLG